MKVKKIIGYTALILMMIFQQSCLTKALWRSESYEENINQFLVGNDGRYVVLMGSSYHYIMTDNSGILLRILALKQQGVLSVDQDKTELELDSNNNISGKLVIKGTHGLLPIEDIAVLQTLGIFPDRKDNISISVKLTGRRYAAKYINPNTAGNATSYKIKVYYDDPNLAKGLGKAAITPITLTVDSVLLIGKVVISAFKL